MKRAVPLIGRILLSLIFIISAFGKIGNFSGTRQFMDGAGMPLTGLLLVLAIIIELSGGFSLLLGFKARWGALALIVFLIPATLIFHNNLGDQNQMIHFMKNLAMVGGLLMVFVFGPGGISFDEKTG